MQRKHMLELPIAATCERRNHPQDRGNSNSRCILWVCILLSVIQDTRGCDASPLCVVATRYQARLR